MADMLPEWQVRHGVQATNAPVARTILLCEDERVLCARFTIVEFVEGLVEARSSAQRGSDSDEMESTRLSVPMPQTR